MSLRVGVLVSGSGTNLQAILDAATSVYEVAIVMSNKPDAFALKRAEAAGLKTLVLLPADFSTREAFDDAVADALEAERVALVCLAGYMRILSAGFVKRFENRILNIHPSLLPAFVGGHAVRDVLEWGARVTGSTVHIVDDELDHGPIVLQEAVDVFPDDTEETLHERIKAVEHRLYPAAIRLFGEGRIRVEGRRVTILPDAG
ncbi:MAG: phosphoribosylglycinamide formyltransferase [Actinomycetota bacterium]|nr:phosphoribosylglycinamide formyltransferase [Actinomycetota bacterium]